MADPDQDPIAELVDWQEHQYSPGQWIKSDYWRNRLSHTSSPEHSNRIWGMTLLEFLIIIPTFLFASYVYLFEERDPYYLILTGILVEYSVIKALLVIRRRPPQDEQGENERKNKKKKKRELPKRPKNYR